MIKVAVSACLLGKNCKYNGQSNCNKAVLDFVKNKEVFPICPEVMGGLSIPRIPAEIVKNKVMNQEGIDVTSYYEKGSNKALDLILKENIQVVIVKEKSPSCGKTLTYDGSFSHQLVHQSGYFVKKLQQHPIIIYSEIDIEKGNM